MYHLRLKGTHYEMGVKRGQIFNKCQITFPLNLDAFQIKHGLECESVLAKYFPEIIEEVKGICDTIKVDFHSFMAWLLAMGCCMYNVDSNTPQIRGCTAFAVANDTDCFYGRNNDLPPFLEKGSKSEIYTLPNRKFNLTTSSFINGEEGMNDAGLVVAMTFVTPHLNAIKGGFTSCFMVRYLLEKATSTKEAIAKIREVPISSPFNIILADKNRDIAVVECSPNAIKVIEPFVFANGYRLVVTVNNFISEDMLVYDNSNGDLFQAKDRYQTVYETIKNANQIDYEMLKGLLAGQNGFICQYAKKENFKTVWSSIFNPLNGFIFRSEGDPRYNKFIEDTRLMLKK